MASEKRYRIEEPDFGTGSPAALRAELAAEAARIHLSVLTHQDAALILLLDQDVSPARIVRWQRTDAADCGLMVDGEKACTIAVGEGVRVTTTWHAPWDARIGR